MAECSYARCIQEKRAIKRELQSWTKNMVYVLGLERVAEELMGRRKWKLYQETLIARHPADRSPSPQPDPSAMPAAEPPPQPPAIKIKTIEQINTATDEEEKVEKGNKPETTILEALIKRPSTHPLREDQEKQGPEDWKPQDKCYFCVDGEGKGVANNDGRGTVSPAPSESSNSEASSERSPAAPPAAPALLAHLLSLQNQSPQAIAQFQSMMAALTTLGGFMPPALQQAWYLRIAQQNQLMQQQQHVDRLTTDMGEKVSVSTSSPTTFQQTASSGVAPSGSEQPLDLSAKSSSSSTEPSTSPEPRVATRVPPIDPKFHDRLKRSTASPTNLAGISSSLSAAAAARRNYTDEDLQNALRDIRSGRLGTRRASVLYGIPRSTIRNNLYKLQDDTNDNDDKDSNADDEWPAHAAPYIRSLLLADNENDSKRAEESPPGVILKIPTFPPPDENDVSPTTTTPVASRAPNFFADPTPPSLPLPPLADINPSALRDESLFVLRDVITKSIHKKFQRPPNSEGVVDVTYERNASARPISVIKNFATQEAQRNSHQASSTSNNINNNGSASNSQAQGGKGTRPKRGKYRNYDRDSLVEAVKAVQRGEMSVHRAGSYYGVPHSTLEYKVKERHLMRPRKREPKNPPADGTSSVRPVDQRPRPTPKPPVKTNASPTASNGLKSGGSFDTALAGGTPFAPGAYPFWARASLTPAFPPFPSAAPELFASHMMQRLREESTPTRAEPPAANGSFLEGIIRSSLERAPERPNSESDGSPPPARRPRLDSSDHVLAADMREAVQRLRAERQPAPDRPDVPAHL